MTSRWGYLIGVLIAFAGLILGIVIIASGASGIAGGLQQVRVPGEATLQLDEAGTYTIFHEQRSSLDGVVYSDTDVTGLSVTVTGPQGQKVPLNAPAASTTYAAGGREGYGMLTFDVETPGPYIIRASYPAGRTGDTAVLAVGSGFMKGLFGTVFGALAAIFGGFVIGLIVFIMTYVRRRPVRRARREKAASA